jgi:hypothetical protein
MYLEAEDPKNPSVIHAAVISRNPSEHSLSLENKVNFFQNANYFLPKGDIDQENGKLLINFEGWKLSYWFDSYSS